MTTLTLVSNSTSNIFCLLLPQLFQFFCHSSLYHHHHTFLLTPAQHYVNVHGSSLSLSLSLSLTIYIYIFKSNRMQLVFVEFGHVYFCYLFLFYFYLVWILCKLFTILLILIISTLAFPHYPFFNCMGCFSRQNLILK